MRFIALLNPFAAPYWTTAAPQKQGQDEERQTTPQEQAQTEKAREKQLKKMKNHSTGDL
jgi:hypothetical protein